MFWVTDIAQDITVEAFVQSGTSSSDDIVYLNEIDLWICDGDGLVSVGGV